MNIWEILGIPPTEDIAEIKSAYAKQAKLNHPEEHPEEFKTLQNAYKIAMKLAKSRRSGISQTYQPSGQMTETPEDELRAESPTEEPEEMLRTETAAEKEPEDSPLGEAEEPAFDFSDVDSYGEREFFFKQFLLLAKNPCLRNRLGTWEYFLHQNEFADLFSHADFRKEVVKTVCGLSGWRRKTILYLEQFLSSFHTKENQPEDGQWETDSRAFRLKKIPRLRLPAFCTDRFFTKEGRAFQKRLHKKVSKLAGREIDLDVQLDLVRYIKFYLFYARPYEAYIDQLYKKWKREQVKVFALAAGLCFFAVMIGTSAMQIKQEAEDQKEYLMELYDSEAETMTEEEQETLRRDYNTYWRYAEEGIDDALGRFEDWERQDPNIK